MKHGKYVWIVVGIFWAVPSTLWAEPPASSSVDEMRLSHFRRRIDWAIDLTQRRYLSPERHTPWQIAHGMKPFGREFQLRRASTGEFVNAVEYFCNEAVSGRQIFQPASHGLRARTGEGLQGHPNQFLAVFALSGVPADQPIRVGGRDYQVADLLEQAKADYYDGQEASWTLIAMATYLPLDSLWRNSAGRQFSLEDLVRAEVAVEPTTAACGGTHNLYALSYALNRFQTHEQTTAGVWRAAQQKVARYKQVTRTLQNTDGSFSSNYFAGSGWPTGDAERLETTGHILEWLALALTDDELSEPWVVRAVESLLDAFERTRKQPVECGPLYHAAHALVLYRDRLRGHEAAIVQAEVGRDDGGYEVPNVPGLPPLADPATP